MVIRFIIMKHTAAHALSLVNAATSHGFTDAKDSDE